MWFRKIGSPHGEANAYCEFSKWPWAQPPRAAYTSQPRLTIVSTERIHFYLGGQSTEEKRNLNRAFCSIDIIYSKYLLSSIYYVFALCWVLKIQAWRTRSLLTGMYSPVCVCNPCVLHVHETSEMDVKTIIAKHSGKCLNQVYQSHICFLSVIISQEKTGKLWEEGQLEPTQRFRYSSD